MRCKLMQLRCAQFRYIRIQDLTWNYHLRQSKPVFDTLIYKGEGLRRYQAPCHRSNSAPKRRNCWRKSYNFNATQIRPPYPCLSVCLSVSVVLSLPPCLGLFLSCESGRCHHASNAITETVRIGSTGSSHNGSVILIYDRLVGRRRRLPLLTHAPTNGRIERTAGIHSLPSRAATATDQTARRPVRINTI